VLDRVHGALMDIYAHAGRAEDVEAMMEKIDQHDPVKYSILVRAYGKMDRADLAMDVVFSRMLNDRNITPAVHVFKMLIVAWAVSSRSDAVEQAHSIFRRMDESAICHQHNLRPDSFMFGGLLKVIGASKRSDSGTRAIAILEDMEQRSRETNDKSLLPNKVIYDLALNVCLQGANDITSTEEILKRMEKSDYPPDLRLYNEVLSSYSLVNSVEATERAEKMLDYIEKLSKSDSQLKPNDFTYNTVINCWITSQDSTAPERAWHVYEQMLEDSVRPNMGTFNALIPFLSKSSRGLLDVGRADELLELMESGKIPGVAPDRRHYGPVMNGWITIGEAQKAADVLLRRVKTYISATSQNKERCKPTPDHFYLVANGWIRNDKLVEATEFIEQMQALFDKGHIPEGPDLYSYLTLHSAWSRSNRSEAARYIEKLDAIILKMRQDNP
jgi:Pentacotripeptide-repeat region of PRORP